jgi:hypothetical protein
MLILKQNAANTVPTPPAGKGTIFLDDSDTLSVKTSDGNVETFPTVSASNSQVVFMNGTALSGEAAFTYDYNNNVLTVAGNVGATRVLTDNLLYANGNPWDLQEAAGSNTQIQFNNNNDFGASANLTFNSGTNLLTLVGTANISEINTTGNLLVGGNLTVNGNVTYVNVDTLTVEDPIISLGGGPNGAPPASDDGKDRGTALQYFSGTAKTAFMGYDNSNAEFGMGNVVSITSDVVTFSTYGNLRVGNIIGNGQALTGLAGGNVTGQVGNALVAGTVYTNAQPNITSVGTLTGVLVGSTSLQADFPNAKAIVSQDNTGQTHSENIGLVGEAVADSGNSATWGIGVLGEARANGGTKATGVQGGAYVTNSADTGAAVGVRGYSTQTHSGGYNIGVLGNAAGSGLGNYAFYVQAGNIASIETDTVWDLYDNSASALAFNSSGKANILAVDTTDGSERVVMSGKLSVTGNANVGNLGAAAGVFTANVTAANIYANSGTIGASILKGEGGNISNIQGANVSGTVGTATTAATVTTNAQPNVTSVGTLTSLDVSGNVTAGNVTGANLVSANYVTGTLTTAAQPNITSVGTLTSLSVTGNVAGGNLNTAGKVVASTLESNVAIGTAPFVVVSTTRVANLNVATAGLANTVNDAAQPNITSVGTLSSLAVTGNVTAGNVYANSGTIGAANLAGTLTTAAQPNITSVGTLSALTVTGKVTAGQLQGDGGNISNVQGANVSGTVASATTAGTVTTAAQPTITSVGTLNGLTLGANLAMGGFNITGLATPNNSTDAATKQYVDDVAQGLNIHDSCQAATPDTLANITSGTISYNNGSNGVGAYLSTTGTFNFIDGVNVQTAGTRILVKDEANAVHNGIYTYTNTTAITRAVDFNTIPEVEAGDFTFVTGGTLYDNTGWVQTESPTGIGTAGNNISFTQFSGAGTYQAGTGLTLIGSVFSVNASQSQITSVGTLDYLAVSNNITSNMSIYANSGTVGASLLTGTLTTNAQPNVTSLGTLSSLSVTGNIDCNASIGGASALIIGNGSSLTALNASNISSGTLAQARLANSSLTVNGTSISLGGSGTITANTTQTLTLGTYLTGTSFNGGTAVTAAVDATSANTASKVVARDASGNFSAGTITATLSGAATSATTAGTVTTAAQPNITSTGTLTSLTVSGNITAQNSIILTNYMIQSVATGISAAGSTQGTATALAKDINVVSTVSAGQGVVLPTAVAGMRITVMNTSATALNVYPATGAAVNGAAANAAYSLLAGGRLDYIATSTTQWYTMNATYA